jgi:16S rRNA processing protein RimM
MSWKSSKPDSPRRLPPTVVVAEVRRPHGLRGEVLLTLLSDIPRRIEQGSELQLVYPDGRREQVEVESARQQKGAVVVRFLGATNRDDAEAFRGGRLEVAEESVPPSPEGSYYYYELLGCACHDEKEGDLGRVVEIVEDGGGLILKLDDGQKELMVPFVRAYLKEVDIAAGTIELDLPEGLVETCGSRS